MSAYQSSLTEDLIKSDCQKTSIVNAKKHEAVLLHLSLRERTTACWDAAHRIIFFFFLLLFLNIHCCGLSDFFENVAHRVQNGWTSQGIKNVAHAIIMLSQVVRDVERGHRAPGEELLGHAWVADLVNHNIKVVYLGEGVHLELSTPFRVASDPADVIVDVFIILDEELVHLLVLLDKLSASVSEFCVAVLCTAELVSKGAEHAVAISDDLLDLQAKSLKIIPKLDHIDLVFAIVHDCTLTFHLSLGAALISLLLLLLHIEFTLRLLLLFLLFLSFFSHFAYCW